MLKIIISVWSGFYTKNFSYLLKILKIASTPSPSLKNPESLNMQIALISTVELLDTRCLRHGEVFFSVCALEASSFHITLLKLDFGPRLASKRAKILVVGTHLKLSFKVSTEEVSSSANKCEKRLLVSLHILHSAQLTHIFEWKGTLSEFFSWEIFMTLFLFEIPFIPNFPALLFQRGPLALSVQTYT